MAMMSETTAKHAEATGFWADLQERLETDPEFAQQYLLDLGKVTASDAIMNHLKECDMGNDTASRRAPDRRG